MSGRLVGIVGAGAFGRDILPLVRASVLATDNIVFVEENALPGKTVDKVPVIPLAAYCLTPQLREFTIAVADPATRERLAIECMRHGAHPFAVLGSSATIFDSAKLGLGSIICAYAFIGPDAQVGDHFHANIYSYIEHDCSVGDYVTLAPRASCNGYVQVEDYAYIGASAVIKQGRRGSPLIIGRGAVVGMGAVVTKNVAAGTTVVGNPARVLRQ